MRSKSLTTEAHVRVEDPQAGAAEVAKSFLKTRRRATRREAILVNVLRVAVLAAAIGGWQLATSERWVDPFFVGTPSGVLEQLKTWVLQGTSQGSIWEQISVTLQETVFGFIIGVATGVLAGVILGRSRRTAAVTAPYVKIVNSFPRIVFGSILTIWVGIGMASKVWLAAILVFFVVFFNAYQGVREADRALMSNARLLGAKRLQLLRDVVIPSALSWIITSLHVALGFALIGAVVGEFLGASHGIGLLIVSSQNTFNPNGVFASMLILAILALVIEGFVTVLERSLLKWQPPPNK